MLTFVLREVKDRNILLKTIIFLLSIFYDLITFNESINSNYI